MLSATGAPVVRRWRRSGQNVIRNISCVIRMKPDWERICPKPELPTVWIGPMTFTVFVRLITSSRICPTMLPARRTFFATARSTLLRCGARPAVMLVERLVLLLSCHRFRANEVRLQLWSLTSLQQRLVKTGGRLIKHARYYWLLLAESHLTRRLFGAMLRRIWALPVPTG